jgi:hypothetical protein
MAWVLFDNPEYAGMEPRPMKAACHDHTPFITLGCPYCKAWNHVHESQFSGAPPDAEVELRCATCRVRQLTTMAFIAGAFEQLRAEGWIAD